MKYNKHYINRLIDMTADELRTACDVHKDCVMNEIVKRGNYKQNGTLYIPVSIWRNQNESKIRNRAREYAEYFKKDGLSDEEAVGTAIIATVGEFFKEIQNEYKCIIVPYKVTTKTFHCLTYVTKNVEQGTQKSEKDEVNNE